MNKTAAIQQFTSCLTKPYKYDEQGIMGTTGEV